MKKNEKAKELKDTGEIPNPEDLDSSTERKATDASLENAKSEVEVAKEIKAGRETVLVFKAQKPLTTIEHEMLSKKIRKEQAASGVKIVLMPYSCDLGGDSNDTNSTGSGSFTGI